MLQLKKTSFIDFPGRISAVFFFAGCNLRCPWCHNRELITGEAEGLVSLEDALAHVRKRRGLLGGVVLSGGEPCLWESLPDLIAEIKALGLPVKLDTNGMFPAMLEKLFSREETRPYYIALDLKIAPARYAELVLKEEKPRRDTEEEKKKTTEDCCPTDSLELHGGKKTIVEVQNSSDKLADNLIQSAALIRKSGIAHEYRSLALPGGFMSAPDIEALAPLADNAPWYFRPFAGGNCLDPAWDRMEESAAEARARLEELAEKARELGKVTR